MFAEASSDTVQIATALIALLGVVVSSVTTYLMARLNAQAAAANAKADKVAAKLETTTKDAADSAKKVATDLHKNTAVTVATARKLDSVAVQVEGVAKAANGLTDALVAEAKKAAFAEGVQSVQGGQP